MTTPAPFDTAKLLSALQPREYDGKEAADARRFAAAARVYYTTATRAGVPSELSWMVILSRLTDTAAQWAGPYMIQVATGTTPPWADADAFAKDFKDHFCAVDDKNAAVAELRKLTKQSHKLGTVKDYTTQFNAIAARTGFSDDDKRDRYVHGLPYKIQDEFAITAHAVGTLAEAQKVALSMDQNLASRAEERPKFKPFGKGRSERLAANQGPKGVCWNCGQPGHLKRDCRNPAQAIASTSTPTPTPATSATTDELVALREQIKAMNERIAAITVAREKEGF